MNTDSKELIGIMKENGMRSVEVINRNLELGGDSIGKGADVTTSVTTARRNPYFNQ